MDERGRRVRVVTNRLSGCILVHPEYSRPWSTASARVSSKLRTDECSAQAAALYARERGD
jgi:hypothetical protein